MTIVARFPVELNGHIFRKGEHCDYSGEITQRIADNFFGEDMKHLVVGASNGVKKEETKDEKSTADEKAEETKAKIAKTVEVMKRNGIIQALDGMGITYSPKSNTDYLAKLLLMNKGEIEE